MANYLLKVGAFTLPDTFYVEKWPTTRNVPSAKLPRADGARTLAGYLEGKTWGVKGGLVSGYDAIPTAPGSLRAQLDALRTALESGPTTFQTHDDRYFRACQVSSFEETYEATAFGHVADISFELVTGDPFAYEFAQQNAARTLSASGQTLAVTAGGNTLALPQVALTMASTGTLAATLTNQTNGDVCTLNGYVTAGDVLVIDSLNKTVTLQSSGADKLTLFDGLFPRLAASANTLQVSYGSGVSVSNISVAFQNRWF